MKLRRARVTEGFWAQRQRLAAERTLWEQLAILKGRRDGLREDQISHAVENFRIAAGRLDAPYRGTVCNDSEVGKWIEAAAYSLMRFEDKALEAEADALIDLILQAQMDDGYVNTYFQALYPQERLKHFGFNCELYNMGHLMEASAAYYKATGKRPFLEGMCRLADLLCERIGPGTEQAHVYDGHAEIELGLLALYEATGAERYLHLAKYFVQERGKQPSFLLDEAPLNDNDPKITDKWFGLDHHQAHKPVAEQRQADGHAVKVTYLFSAATDLVRLGQDDTGELDEAVHAVWENMTKRRMYITGAIGSQGYGERFTVDGDLPPDRGYAETCASIGIAMWGSRLLRQRHDGAVYDAVETALYNGMLAGWSLDGDRYFYVNMLHCKRAVMAYRQDQAYMALQRSPWFECACCPSNILRVVCRIEDYLFSADENTLYIDGYAGAQIELEHGGVAGRFAIETDYPYDGAAVLRYTSREAARFRLALRKPGWCERMSVCVNGETADCEEALGYRVLEREWQDGDTVCVDMRMDIQYMVSAPAMWETSGRAAMTRGPLVYCVESVDNAQGLDGLIYRPGEDGEIRRDTFGPEGIPFIETAGYRQPESEMPYSRYPFVPRPCRIRAIPYFAWGNRGESDMDVWLPFR